MAAVFRFGVDPRFAVVLRFAVARFAVLLRVVFFAVVRRFGAAFFNVERFAPPLRRAPAVRAVESVALIAVGAAGVGIAGCAAGHTEPGCCCCSLGQPGPLFSPLIASSTRVLPACVVITNRSPRRKHHRFIRGAIAGPEEPHEDFAREQATARRETRDIDAGTDEAETLR